MRDRLIELLDKANETILGFFIEGDTTVLADHLLAEGVIVPPVKVGDTVWIAGEHRGVYCANVRVLFFDEKGIEMVRTTQCDIPFSAFGKTVFLTRELAEEALKNEQEKL